MERQTQHDDQRENEGGYECFNHGCYSRTIRKGIARVATPIIDPRMVSVSDLRLCSGILTEFNFALDNVAECGGEHDPDADESGNADESETDVVAREDGPGLHV